MQPTREKSQVDTGIPIDWNKSYLSTLRCKILKLVWSEFHRIRLYLVKIMSIIIQEFYELNKLNEVFHKIKNL